MGNKISNAACCFTAEADPFDVKQCHKEFLEEANISLKNKLRRERNRRRKSNFKPYHKRVQPEFHSQVEIDIVSTQSELSYTSFSAASASNDSSVSALSNGSDAFEQMVVLF